MKYVGSVKRWRPSAVLAVVAVLSACCLPAVSAESEFVGILAMLEEKSVADELGLSEGQKQQLRQLIANREGSDELIELIMEIKDLSPDERSRRLAPYRQASESHENRPSS